MEDCKHEKATESRTVTGPVTNIVYRCDSCSAIRNREIFSIRLGPEGGFTCFSENLGIWEAIVLK